MYFKFQPDEVTDPEERYNEEFELDPEVLKFINQILLLLDDYLKPVISRLVYTMIIGLGNVTNFQFSQIENLFNYILCAIA